MIFIAGPVITFVVETGKKWVDDTGRCESSVFFLFVCFFPLGVEVEDGMKLHFPLKRREFLPASPFYQPPKKERVLPFQPVGRILLLF